MEKLNLAAQNKLCNLKIVTYIKLMKVHITIMNLKKPNLISPILIILVLLY